MVSSFGLPGRIRKLSLSENDNPRSCPLCGELVSAHPTPHPGQPPETSCLMLKDQQIDSKDQYIDQLRGKHKKQMLTAAVVSEAKSKALENALKEEHEARLRAEQKLDELKQSMGSGDKLWRRLDKGKPLTIKDKRFIYLHPDVLEFLDKTWKDGYEIGRKKERAERLKEERYNRGDPEGCTCFLGHPPCSYCESLSEEEVDLLYDDIPELYAESAIAKSVNESNVKNESQVSEIKCIKEV